MNLMTFVNTGPDVAKEIVNPSSRDDGESKTNNVNKSIFIRGREIKY